MTDSVTLTVADLLGDLHQMEPVLKEALDKEGTGAPAKFAWGIMGSQATTAVKSVLNFNVFDAVAQGWCTLKSLHEYTDRAKHPPSEQSLLYLGEHTFVKEFNPVLNVAIGSLPAASLRFTLQLAVDVRAVALGICNGFITGIGSGDGSVAARLKYGTVDLTGRESKRVRLPAKLDFKAPGLPIL